MTTTTMAAKGTDKAATAAHPGSITVRWRSSGAARYAVYRAAGKRAGCAPIDPHTLIATTGAPTFTDPAVRPGASYTYYVTALDRANRESAPARGSTITSPRG
jgi:hypothetical protein